MKQSAIRVGKKYMLSLGRRGAVAVTVEGRKMSTGLFVCSRDGGIVEASARELSPCPVTDRDGNLLGNAHEMPACDCKVTMRRSLWCDVCAGN